MNQSQSQRDQVGQEVVASGRFIVFEGIDGSGKTSVALRVRDALTEFLPRRPFFTREPTSSEVTEWLRHEDDHVARMLLYLLDRVRHVRLIRQALSDGYWVICDRYLPSTLVYNPIPVLDGEMSSEQFQRFVLWCARGLYPHLTLWLDCDVDMALGRIRDRGLFESMADRELLLEARVRYERVMSGLPDVVRVDASGSLDQVVSQCLEVIERRFLADV